MTRTQFEEAMKENGVTFSLMYGNKCAGYVEFTYYVTIETYDGSQYKDMEIETEYLDCETYILTVKINN